MFSGIVEGLREIKDIKEKTDFKTFQIDLENFASDKKVGDSVAINGTCLTITKLDNKVAHFDIMHETLKKTNLGDYKIGDKVNIERSLKVGERLDGHFVLGHVDGMGIVKDIKKTEDNCEMWIELPKNLEYGLIPTGSIGVDGISLTIANIKDNRFKIALIPHTLKITTLGKKKLGDKVNIEIDYLGKWIMKIQENKN